MLAARAYRDGSVYCWNLDLVATRVVLPSIPLIVDMDSVLGISRLYGYFHCRGVACEMLLEEVKVGKVKVCYVIREMGARSARYGWRRVWGISWEDEGKSCVYGGGREFTTGLSPFRLSEEKSLEKACL